MRKWLVLLVFVVGSAFAIDNVSVAGSLGYSGGLLGGVEASWDCILYQPKTGALRPTLDLGYGTGGLAGAFTMRYLMDATEGVKVGGGLGLRYQRGVQAYIRGDAEYDLSSMVDLPVFVGADLGYAFGIGAAPSGVVAQFKAGYRF